MEKWNIRMIGVYNIPTTEGSPYEAKQIRMDGYSIVYVFLNRTQ